MSNPYSRLEELEQKLGVTRAQLDKVSSQLEALGQPPFLDSPATDSRNTASGEVLSKESTALTREEQQQKAERFPDKLELYTSLSMEKGRLEKEVGGLESDRAHAKDDVFRIEQMRGELEHVNGQIDEAKAENIEALKAYDDKITSLKNDTDRPYTIHDLYELKDLDAKIDSCQERQDELEGRRNDIVMNICDVFHGNLEPALGPRDAEAIGTATRDGRSELGPAEESIKRTESVDDRKREAVIELGEQAMDATKTTGLQIEGIGKDSVPIPYPPPTQEVVGICEKPWAEFMPQATAIHDPMLMLILGVGTLLTVGKELGKDVYEGLTNSDPEKARANETKQLSRDYCDDMRDLGKEHQAEREQLVESLQSRNADPATIERQTGKQAELQAAQIDERRGEWDQKFSEMWQRHENERTPYETEKANAPDQVREKINDWDRSGWPQYVQQQREQQLPER